MPPPTSFGDEGNQMGLGEPTSILTIQLMAIAAGRRMARDACACGNEATIVALGGNDADIIGRGAAGSAGVFYDV